MPNALLIEGLFRYPVKSLGGNQLEAAPVGPYGIAFDREWMVVGPDGRFLTQREIPGMALVETRILGERSLRLRKAGMQDIEIPLALRRRANASRRAVQVWDDSLEAIEEDPQANFWLSQALGQECQLVRFPPDHIRHPRKGQGSRVAFADGYSFLVVSSASLHDLNARIEADGGSPVPMNRFRPNIVLAESEAYAEDSWRMLKIGEVFLAGQTTCVRCPITVTDQATAARGKEPLRTLARYRHDRERGGVIFGRNFIHLTQGHLRAGQEVEAS